MRNHGTFIPEVYAGINIEPIINLRDYFAAHALTGMMASYDDNIEESAISNNKEWDVFVAENAYSLADAMMEARKNPYRSRG